MELKELLGNEYKDEMTVEEINKVLSTKEFVEKDKYDRLKTSFDKTASETAKYKKQLEGANTEKETQMTEKSELEKKVEEMQKHLNISDTKAKLLGLGYDNDLATECATAMVDGDIDTVIRCQTSFKDKTVSSVKSDVLKETPKPETGSKESNLTLADLRKMSVADQYKFSKEHPDEYKKLYNERE